MNPKKPYYNHDATWALRRNAKSPVWGSYSIFLYKQVINQLIGSVASGGRILDIGCGAGKFGLMVNEAGFCYTGVDESREAILLGKEFWPELKLYCLDFALPLDSHLEFARDSFDAIVSINVLHCLEDEKERLTFLSNARSMIRENGIFILTTMLKPPSEAYRQGTNFRAYKEAPQILLECSQSGFELVGQTVREASAQNPIPNLELTLKTAATRNQ